MCCLPQLLNPGRASSSAGSAGWAVLAVHCRVAQRCGVAPRASLLRQVTLPGYRWT